MRLGIVGLGASGRAAAEVATTLGAVVAGYDASAAAVEAAAADLPGATLAHVADPAALAAAVLDGGPDVVVVSPGVPSHAPLYGAAAAAGVPVWSEVELAWRVRAPRADGTHAPWLTLTGTNGKTTTVGMLSAMLQAGGLTAPAVGNVGEPIVRVAAAGGVDALAVELSSFQLHSTHSVAPLASACLNIAADHLDWHGGWEGYWTDKARVFARTELACVYSTADRQTRRMVEEAEVAEGCRAIGFRLGSPAVGEVGLVEDVLVDRAFVAERRTHAAELGTLADLAQLAPREGGDVPPHVIANALAAAALARAAGVEPGAVRGALRSFRPDHHRIELVGTVGGVAWVNDSKATNAHAARASLAALPDGTAVWIAGGLAKGATFDELVAEVAVKLRAVVLIGKDRAPLRDALARHAPQVPRFEVEAGDDGEVMRQAVVAASRLARPGDTVMMAPASASMDQFVSYAHRGEAFTRAVAELEG
ncbi:MAG: UDP-N-acetylmuramoyl-L-alanine--D-glutamate ligase [bacterium]|nr:UDP-N-acetylmuramoyl-L-alanine--D-glutamate ligase [bacterium]